MPQVPRYIATTQAAIGSLILAVGLLRGPAGSRALQLGRPDVSAIAFLVLAALVVHSTRRNSIAYTWSVLGALSWVVFFGRTVPGCLLLLLAGGMHLSVVDAGWRVVLAPCWWILGALAWFRVATFVAILNAERGGGEFIGLPMTTELWWVVGAAILALLTDRLIQILH